ncbi:MAG TPA: 50S ribosomal protein L3 [Gemmatimonadaceae bacterium]|nr:50S ribosomal protein L3 [Gemmatimonadaceae bacterium]
MLGIIGKKLGMTQVFNEQGHQVPCTVVEAKPNPVTKVISGERVKPGYRAIELGYGSQTARRDSKKGEHTPRGRRANKAEVQHAAKAGVAVVPRTLRAFRLDDMPAGTELPEYKAGDAIDVSIFAPGEMVKVTGTSKGRGFQGVVKRYGIGGGPNTHGNTKHRRPGSVGAGTDPSRVIKGKKMPGQYGNKRHTQTNLRVEKIDAQRHLIYIRGAVAGPTNGIVLVRKQQG